MLIDEVFLIYAYTSPLSVQSRLLNEKPYDIIGWEYFRQVEHSDLFKDCLGLFLEEISLRRDFQIDHEELQSLAKYLEINVAFSMKEYLADCLKSTQWKEPLRMETLLKQHGLPSKIPVLKKVFRATDTILSAIKSTIESDGTVQFNLDGINPIWSRIILPALNSEITVSHLNARIPDNVLQQAQLYLDTTKPFLLFKFDPALY